MVPRAMFSAILRISNLAIKPHLMAISIASSTPRKPDKEILEHDRKREVEVKVLSYGTNSRMKGMLTPQFAPGSGPFL